MQSFQMHATLTRPTCIVGSALRGKVLSARPVQAQRARVASRVATAATPSWEKKSDGPKKISSGKLADEGRSLKDEIAAKAKGAPQDKPAEAPASGDDDGDNAATRAAAGVFAEKPAFEVGKKYVPKS